VRVPNSTFDGGGKCYLTQCYTGVIDKERLIEKVAKINNDILGKIENSIIFILGIKNI
jgi:hypothetical protein